MNRHRRPCAPRRRSFKPEVCQLENRNNPNDLFNLSGLSLFGMGFSAAGDTGASVVVSAPASMVARPDLHSQVSVVENWSWPVFPPKQESTGSSWTPAEPAAGDSWTEARFSLGTPGFNGWANDVYAALVGVASPNSAAGSAGAAAAPTTAALKSTLGPTSAGKLDSVGNAVADTALLRAASSAPAGKLGAASPAGLVALQQAAPAGFSPAAMTSQLWNNDDSFAGKFLAAFVAEGRIGNTVTGGGTHELDIGRSTSGPFVAGNTANFAWPQVNGVPFQLTYNHSTRTATFINNVGAANQTTVTYNNVVWPAGGADTIYVRVAASKLNTSLEVSDLRIKTPGMAEAVVLPNPNENPPGAAHVRAVNVGTSSKQSLRITGLNLQQDWELTGSSFWTFPTTPATAPKQSELAFQIKIGRDPLVDLQIFKPRVIDPAETVIAENVELNRGSQTWVNLDNDDNDGTYDAGDTAIPGGDDELAKIRLVVSPTDATLGKVTLTGLAGGGDIRVWKSNASFLPEDEYALGTQLDVAAEFTLQDGVYVKDMWLEGVNASTVQQQVKLRLTYDQAPGREDSVALTVLGIQSIAWQGRNNSIGHNNTLDADPNFAPNMPAGTALSAVRVFPDARVVAGAVEAALREQVDVVARLTVRPVDPVDVFFRSFDVDDPTERTDPLDNDAAGAPAARAQDNRGTLPAPNGAFVGEAGGLLRRQFTNQTDTFQFIVTAQPGDNFRVVGNGDADFLPRLENDDRVLDVGANDAERNENKQRIVNLDVRAANAGAAPSTWEVRQAGNYVSPVLTVWRFLHVERDSYAAPGAGVVFNAANDDVNPGNLGNSDITLLVEQLRRAYIETVDDLAVLDTRDEIAFVRNLPDANARVTATGVRDVNSLPRFWVVQIVAAYEGEPSEDFDPNTEDATMGFSPAATVAEPQGGAMIYHEVIRDVSANFPGAVARATLEPRIVLHEVLHRFAIGHPTGGVMDALTNVTGTNAANELNVDQLNTIRAQSRPGP